ncbi:MAG: hypothetical protein ACJATI_004470 [Halioglobus sp.]|jgi:hypothetical protein
MSSIFNSFAQPDVDRWDEKIQSSIADLVQPKVVVSPGCDWIPPYLDDIGAIESFRTYMSNLPDAIYVKTVKSYKALKNTLLKTEESWLETLVEWQNNGVIIEGTTWGTLIKNVSGVEIGRIVDGNKLIIKQWDLPLYNPLSSVINELPKINYDLVPGGSTINGNLELVLSNGSLVFRRKYSPGCGAIVNFDNINLQGILDLSHFDPNLGFSGVYHLPSNKFIIIPSAKFIPIDPTEVPEVIFYKGGELKIDYDNTSSTYFAVNRNGGHISGANILGDIIESYGFNNKAGFAVEILDESTLKINFKSAGLNKQYHPTGTPDDIASILPQDLQNQIVPIIQSRFPNMEIIISQ